MCLQAGAAAVSADQKEVTGSKHQSSTAPTGPTPMDTDQTILSSALSTPCSKSAPDSAELQKSAASQTPAQTSDSIMIDAAQTLSRSDVAGDAGQHESAASGPSGANDSSLSQLGSKHEQDVAQLGFAVQFTVQGLRNGAGPTLMPLLPFLLKKQV